MQKIPLTNHISTYNVGTVGKCFGGSNCSCYLVEKCNGYYGYYKITIYNSTDKKTTYKYWDGGETCKIELGRNKTYKITVAYNNTETIKNCQANWDKNISAYYKNQGFTKVHKATCSWYVSSTNKVSSYS